MNTTECTPHTVAERLGLCLPRLVAHLANETTTVDSLPFDSMDTVELLCVVHEEFGVRLTDHEFHPQQTIGGLLAAIAQAAKML